MKIFLPFCGAALVIIGASGSALAEKDSAAASGPASYVCFTECGEKLGHAGTAYLTGVLLLAGPKAAESLAPSCVLYGIPGKSAIPSRAPAAANQHIVIKSREVEDGLIFDDVTTRTEIQEKRAMPYSVEPQIIYQVYLHKKPVFEKMVAAYVEQGICKTVTDLSSPLKEESDS